MKHNLVLIVVLFSITLLFSADLIPDSPEYNAHKLSLVNPAAQTVVAPIPVSGDSPKDPPALLIPLDGDFIQAMGRNDDGSSAQISLPWTFSLYGTPYTSFWINNNGNITFTGSYGSFTSTGFPLSGVPMLAPFWADVDTRNTASGLVYYKITSNPNRCVVIWDQVGYYSNGVDKLNTFSAIFTDGTDPLIGIGNNVVFSYADMQWTTGSASNGVNGFGGIAATVGINEGVGGNYTQAGRFDQPGTAYDGEAGANDGVDWLDDRDLYLAASGATILIVLPADPEEVTQGPGMPPGVVITDPTYDTYTATYNAAGTQTVTIPVGAGTWRGWIYYSGEWHEADVFPYTGPGFVVFSNVPFTGGKDTKPIIIDLEDDETLPVELSSFTATLTAQNYVKLSWVTQSETGLNGYYVFRATMADLSTAQMVSPLIPGTNTSVQQQYQYTDEELYDVGTYYYWLQSYELDGSSDFHGPVSVLFNPDGDIPQPEIPTVTALNRIYPNPFNPIAGISYSLKESLPVELNIYNSRGQIVRSFKALPTQAGNHRLTWDGCDAAGKVCSSGAYLFILKAGSELYTQKAVLMK